MNLLPVGAPVTPPGETPIAPIEGGETADIGFAALIAGLMAGDQQIVPTIEPAPVTREDGLEAPIGSTEADDIIGQFSLLPPVELDPKKTDVVGGSVDRATAPTQISYSATSLTKPSHDDDPTTGPTELLPSPTVTSGSELVPTNLAQLEGDTAPAADTVSLVAPHAAVAASIPPTEDSVTPVEATPAAVTPGLVKPIDVTPRQSTSPPIHNATAQTHRSGSAEASPNPRPPSPEVAVDTAGVTARVEMTGSTDAALEASESPEPARESQQQSPVESTHRVKGIGEPAKGVRDVMSTVAQRVEQAVRALEARPDPKIVTLQLDELDGLRLTVALRPDGVSVSSDSEPTLVSEIRRALDSRGFEMSEHRETADDPRDQLDADDFKQMRRTQGRTARNRPNSIAL